MTVQVYQNVHTLFRVLWLGTAVCYPCFLCVPWEGICSELAIDQTLCLQVRSDSSPDDWFAFSWAAVFSFVKKEKYLLYSPENWVMWIRFHSSVSFCFPFILTQRSLLGLWLIHRPLCRLMLRHFPVPSAQIFFWMRPSCGCVHAKFLSSRASWPLWPLCLLFVSLSELASSVCYM